MTESDPKWHVPVRLDDVPQSGLHLDLVADEAVRESLGALAGLRELQNLEAAVDLVREGNGLRASGRVSATVGQTCVVTLEPIQGKVEEFFDVVFCPAATEDQAAASQHDGEEAPELLVDGIADVGAIVTEFFLLGIDRYPRKPGAVFTVPVVDGDSAGPFAPLARLKKESGEP